MFVYDILECWVLWRVVLCTFWLKTNWKMQKQHLHIIELFSRLWFWILLFFFNSPVFRTEVRLAIQSLWESNNICRFKVFGSWKSILSPALYPPSSPLCSALYKGIARFPGYRPCTAPLFLRWCLLPMSYLFILVGECLALGPYKAWEIIWSIPDKVLGVS